MSKTTTYRVFLASPSDVDVERNIIESCIDSYNANKSRYSGVRFEIARWEQVPGTAKRPQDAINQLIGECHFMVVLFASAWGSDPGGTWGYTSGTEEELFRGLLEACQREQPMRDIWLAFVESDTPAKEIMDLKGQIREKHSMLYESISNALDLEEKFMSRLEGWASDTGPKRPLSVDLIPASGKDVLGAAQDRLRGLSLIALGQLDTGVDSLKRAAKHGGPEELIEYARHLLRVGDTDQANEIAQDAIDFLSADGRSLHSSLMGEAFTLQAQVLQRKGKTYDAVARLETVEALLPEESDIHTERVRCRVLDALGLARQKTGNLDGARDAFTRALESRRKNDDSPGIAQSQINLARIDSANGEFGHALVKASDAAEILRKTSPSGLRANGEVLLAQTLLRLDRAVEGVGHALEALALNRQLSNKNGEAISSFLLAQCYQLSGSTDMAVKYADISKALNREMKNLDGVKRVDDFLEANGLLQ